MHKLMGYAPQTVTGAAVLEPALAAALGRATLTVAFPRDQSTTSLHWGLMDGLSGRGRALISGTAQECLVGSQGGCNAGGVMSERPLAVEVKVTDATQAGGRVIYTSFHNIEQPSDDVRAVLTYVIFHL